jgi:hypothetical protein
LKKIAPQAKKVDFWQKNEYIKRNVRVSTLRDPDSKLAAEKYHFSYNKKLAAEKYFSVENFAYFFTPEKHFPNEKRDNFLLCRSY